MAGGVRFLFSVLRCVVFEDEHLLVVNKPAGWNTHAPSPHAGEGIYEWLRHREPRWANLAIIHRLDKETSGLLLFAKTALANRSLTDQFTHRRVRKQYWLLTDRRVPPTPLTVKTALVRVGDRYQARPPHAGAELAETQFRLLPGRAQQLAGEGGSPPGPGWRLDPGLLQLVEAVPVTGRTHQIRVHAASRGFPILGDSLYEGTSGPRTCLHAAELSAQHPATGEPLVFRAPAMFFTALTAGLREACVEPELTTAWRIIHGATDGWPGWYVDRLGDYFLSQSERLLAPAQKEVLSAWLDALGAKGVAHKVLSRHVRRSTPEEAAPQPVLGETAPARFHARENGLTFELSFAEGYSVGLFLDQRDNRRRVLTGHVAAGFPLWPNAGPASGCTALNTFAYTCAFSVCSAQAGARTTSVDLSKKYLDWGRQNFRLNQLDPDAHDFIYGDVFDWLRRLAKKGRQFDLVLLDPPTFSQSRESGVFRADRDYGKLVAAATDVLKPGGVLFTSTNAADWSPAEFLGAVEAGLSQKRRRVVQSHYVPQPPDFPVSRGEPAYLKTAWWRVE